MDELERHKKALRKELTSLEEELRVSVKRKVDSISHPDVVGYGMTLLLLQRLMMPIPEFIMELHRIEYLKAVVKSYKESFDRETRVALSDNKSF